MGKIEKRGF